jgi:hypothetical protein
MEIPSPTSFWANTGSGTSCKATSGPERGAIKDNVRISDIKIPVYNLNDSKPEQVVYGRSYHAGSKIDIAETIISHADSDHWKFYRLVALSCRNSLSTSLFR